MKTIFALAVVLAVSALSAAGAVPDFEPLQDVVDQIKTASNGELTVSTGNLISFVQDTDTDVTTSINEIKELIGTVPQLPDLVSTLNKAAVALGGLLQKLITSFLNVLTQILNDINRNALKTLTNVSELVVKTEQDLQECATKQIQVIQGLLDELKGLLKNINAGVQVNFYRHVFKHTNTIILI